MQGKAYDKPVSEKIHVKLKRHTCIRLACSDRSLRKLHINYNKHDSNMVVNLLVDTTVKVKG